jgi:hypothetical protein
MFIKTTLYYSVRKILIKIYFGWIEQDGGLLTSLYSSSDYPEEERSGTPKGTHKVPQPVRNKALSESTNREVTNHGKNEKSDSQPNTPCFPSLKSPCRSRLYYLAFSWW